MMKEKFIIFVVYFNLLILLTDKLISAIIFINNIIFLN